MYPYALSKYSYGASRRFRPSFRPTYRRRSSAPYVRAKLGYNRAKVGRFYKCRSNGGAFRGCIKKASKQYRWKWEKGEDGAYYKVPRAGYVAVPFQSSGVRFVKQQNVSTAPEVNVRLSSTSVEQILTLQNFSRPRHKISNFAKGKNLIQSMKSSLKFEEINHKIDEDLNDCVDRCLFIFFLLCLLTLFFVLAFVRNV